MIPNKKNELAEFIKILKNHGAREITDDEKESPEFRDSIIRSRKLVASHKKNNRYK
jgi:hypothetical protein